VALLSQQGLLTKGLVCRGDIRQQRPSGHFALQLQLWELNSKPCDCEPKDKRERTFLARQQHDRLDRLKSTARRDYHTVVVLSGSYNNSLIPEFASTAAAPPTHKMRVLSCLALAMIAAVATAEHAVVDELVSSVTDAAASAASNVVSDTTNAVTDTVASAATDAATTAADTVASAAGTSVDSVADTVSNATDTVSDTANAAGSLLDSAGSVIDDAASIASSVADDVASAAGSATASGSSAAPSLHQSSGLVMAALAVAGLALNFA
jgi:hypothetical protein